MRRMSPVISPDAGGKPSKVVWLDILPKRKSCRANKIWPPFSLEGGKNNHLHRFTTRLNDRGSVHASTQISSARPGGSSRDLCHKF